MLKSKTLRQHQQELDTLHVEIQDYQNQTSSVYKQFTETFNEMRTSMDLLHQQILTCHEQITLFKQSPRGKGHGRP